MSNENLLHVNKKGHTWLLLGRVGLAAPCSATESEAGEARAEEGLNSWRVAREGGRGWGAS